MPFAIFFIPNMGAFYEKAIKKLLDSLENDARRILRECVEERTYQHRTRNLYDSYGYGIYVDGELKRTGYLSSSPMAKVPRHIYGKDVRGREEIRSYLEGNKKKGGIALAIVAAMPYAKILEEGGGRLKHSYRVISMSFQKLEQIAGKYNATVSAIK